MNSIRDALLSVIAVCLLVPSLAQADTREVTRTRSFDAAAINSLVVSSEVGSVRIEAGASEAIEVRVTLKAKRTTGWFSTLPDVSQIDFSSTTRGDELTLNVDNKNVEENWVIKLPKKRLSAIEIKLGVGQVSIDAAARRVEVDVGVGGAELSVSEGAIALNIGTGDARIRTAVSNAGEITGTAGVGNISLEGGSGTVTSKMIGGRLSARGRGVAPIEATIGVGDLSVTLTE